MSCIAARNTMFGGKKKTGCHIALRFDSTTGLTITWHFRESGTRNAGKTFTVDWGDGSSLETRTWSTTANTHFDNISHTYPAYGDYTMVITGVLSGSFGIRTGDSSTHYNYEKAILSIIDYDNVVMEGGSGVFKYCTNLTTVITPATLAYGQGDFQGCTSLQTFVGGCPGIYYDSVFNGCTNLSSFTVNYDTMLPIWEELNVNLSTRSCTCWHNVWNGCSSLTELNLGHITQIGNSDFANCPNLTDVYITNRTTTEIKNSFGKSYILPWGAASTVKFHGTDGYVLGDGTIVT